eukprot:77933-Prorocentrum_minimum.AAC.1
MKVEWGRMLTRGPTPMGEDVDSRPDPNRRAVPPKLVRVTKTQGETKACLYECDIKNKRKNLLCANTQRRSGWRGRALAREQAKL